MVKRRYVTAPDKPERTGGVAFVGEAPGAEEIRQDRYFVGKSGKLFDLFLRRAGLKREQCLVTNVFNFELPNNDVKRISVSQAKAKKAPAEVFPKWSGVPVDSGAYVPGDIIDQQLKRLSDELHAAAPNVIVPLGGTAVWAILRAAPYGKMRKIRGTLTESAWGPKAIPTYHPAYISRAFHHSPMLFSDFVKARRESAHAELRLPARNAVVASNLESLDSLRDFQERGDPVAVDIETAFGQIDCIGFAADSDEAFVVPFARIVGKKKGHKPLAHYWDTPERELAALQAVADFLADERVPKIMQNGSYDVAWILEEWGVTTRNWRDDTRLQHLALWPELPGDLATMTSLHLTVPPWKLRGKHTDKPDE